MSLLKIEDKSFQNLKDFGQTDSLEQINMSIYSKLFTAGQHKIPIKINRGDFIYIQIFIMPNPNASTYTCGGDLLDLSL